MIRSFVQVLIRQYKRTFSSTLLSTCRFTPTCSDYALEAIERHGLVSGAVLSSWRIARCNPFFRGGLDIVPAKAPGKLFNKGSRTHICPISAHGKN